MQKTSNYNLNQWESTDPIRREDFNADNAAIDAALGAVSTAVESKAEQSALAGLIVTGTYVGTSTPTGKTKQTIELGFQPRFLFIRNTAYKGSSSVGDDWTPHHLAFATPEHGHYVYGDTRVVLITTTGFTVGGINGMFNSMDSTYAYLAVR